MNKRSLLSKISDGLIIGLVLGIVGTVTSIFLTHLWTTASGFTEAVVEMDKALWELSNTVSALSDKVDDLEPGASTSGYSPTSSEVEVLESTHFPDMPTPAPPAEIPDLPAYQRKFNK